jgi:hypothetical protein
MQGMQGIRARELAKMNADKKQMPNAKRHIWEHALFSILHSTFGI